MAQVSASAAAPDLAISDRTPLGGEAISRRGAAGFENLAWHLEEGVAAAIPEDPAGQSRQKHRSSSRQCSIASAVEEAGLPTTESAAPSAASKSGGSTCGAGNLAPVHLAESAEASSPDEPQEHSYGGVLDRRGARSACECEPFLQQARNVCGTEVQQEPRAQTLKIACAVSVLFGVVFAVLGVMQVLRLSSAALRDGEAPPSAASQAAGALLGQPWAAPASAASYTRSTQMEDGGADSDGLCSSGASIPTPKQDLWDLPLRMRQFCESKNREANAWQYPEGRNWCWLALKAQCHADLKTHRPWSVIAANAAKLHRIPSLDESAYAPLQHASLCDRRASGKAPAWTAQERASARAWFRDHVSVYVLGLRSAQGRWSSSYARLEELNIYATHIDGVDMRREGMLETAKAQGWMPSGFNFTLAQHNAYGDKNQMGPILGTSGCASAHFKAQIKALADGSPLAVVLEDDVHVAEDFVERLWHLVLTELPCDWEVTSLYSRCPFGTCVSRHLSRVQPDANEPRWRCRQGVNWGMQGMLYRMSKLPGVQRKWMPVVFDEARPHCMDVDVALASISDDVVYYAVPSVQDPGFLREADRGSSRWDINQASGTLKPTSTDRTTTAAPTA